jgi:hypothetical protein
MRQMSETVSDPVLERPQVTTPTEQLHHESASQTPNNGHRRRRTIAITAAAVAVVVASIAVVDAKSSPDDGPEQIALGSTWS